MVMDNIWLKQAYPVPQVFSKARANGCEHKLPVRWCSQQPGRFVARCVWFLVVMDQYVAIDAGGLLRRNQLSEEVLYASCERRKILADMENFHLSGFRSQALFLRGCFVVCWSNSPRRRWFSSVRTASF